MYVGTMQQVPQLPLPLLRRQSGRDDIKSIEGYSVSSTIATTSAFLVVSYATMVVAPSPFVFATTTNLCYLATGFWRELVSATDKHSATLLVGQMAGGSLVLVLMGASSFAFHRHSVMYSPAHTLDILFGWLLVAHVFYVSFSVTLMAFVRYAFTNKRDTFATRVVRTVLSVCFLIFVTLLMTFYDTFYSSQTTYYFVVGPAAAIFGALCRSILVWEEGAVRWYAVRIALFEMVVALTAVFAAILSQGELLGRRMSRSTDAEGYDFYHGQWHFLLALVVGLLYSRAADAARIVQGTHAVCVCTLPYLDWVGEVLLLVYSTLVILFKELDVSLIYAKSILGALAGLFMMHALVTLGVWWAGDAGDPMITPRPLSTPRAPGGYAPLKQGDVELAATPALTFRIRSMR